MTTGVEMAGNVWLRYRARLDEVQRRIADDAHADPKSAPSQALTEERWRLEGKLRLVERLAVLFSEEGI